MCLCTCLPCILLLNADLLLQGITMAIFRHIFHCGLKNRTCEALPNLIYSFVWVNVIFGSSVELLRIFQLLHSHSLCKRWTELPGGDVTPASLFYNILLFFCHRSHFFLSMWIFLYCCDYF